MWCHSSPHITLSNISSWKDIKSIPLSVAMETKNSPLYYYSVLATPVTISKKTHPRSGPRTWELFLFLHRRVAKVDFFRPVHTPGVFKQNTRKILGKEIKGINNRFGMLSMHIRGQDVAVTAHGMQWPLAEVTMLVITDNTLGYRRTNCYHGGTAQGLSSWRTMIYSKCISNLNISLSFTLGE